MTIGIKHIRAFSSADGSDCDVSGQCDPYVKLFINNEKVNQTKVWENTCCFNANAWYQSIKIPKKSTLKIEIWDDDSGFFGTADDLILQTQGSIDSFLKTSIHLSARKNVMETITFWQDEFE